MPEAAIGSPERVAQHVVTGENRQAFMERRLDIAAPAPVKAEQAPKVEAKGEPAKAAQAEQAKATPDPDAEALEADRASEPDPKKPNPKLQQRFSELTNRRKEAEAKAEAAERARLAAEKELAELRAKNAPPPVEVGVEPQRAQFATEDEYLTARVDYTVKKTLDARQKGESEARQKAEADRVVTRYGERLSAAKAEIPDFDARIEKAKDLPIPLHIRDALFESEVGPRVALHFADHPDEAVRIGKMSPAAALREFGKIEAMIETAAALDKVAREPKKEPAKSAAEVSKAPPPIEPIKGVSGAIEAKVDSEGRFTGTYAEFKAARKRGQIK